MSTIAQAACELLEKGEPFILATIVSHSGSTPRTAGSRMIITADGRGVGTIGGGLLEAEAMSRAVELVRKGQSAVMPFDLSDDNVATMDMICGGQADVLLAYAAATEVNRTVFDRWRRVLDQRPGDCLITVVLGSEKKIDAVAHCLVTATGKIIGDFPLSGAEREMALTAAAGSTTARWLALDTGFVLVEPTRRVPGAYLFGAGHVAGYTAAVAALAGFRVSVSDDRAEYANRERFPDAHEIRVLENFDDAISGLSIGREDFIVILTRGHLHDKTVLAQALRTDAGYIGMIGSQRKRNAIYGALFGEGFSEADIHRVHSPIGLSIGAETPEEIAVSIVAEMIRDRANSLNAQR